MTGPPSEISNGHSLISLLFDRSPEAKAFVDSESGTIQRVNPRFAKWVAIAPEKLTGTIFPNWSQLKSAEEGVVSFATGKSVRHGMARLVLPLPGEQVTLCVVDPRPRPTVQDEASRDLQHRLRNMLAVIRSIFRRTAQNSESVDELVSHFLGRLDAFGRVQSNISLYDRFGIELDDLILNELAAHALRPEGRLNVKGPPLRLRTRPGETLGLAIHEIVTNSIKYGALGSAEGTVTVEWQLVDSPLMKTLVITWIESHVPDMPTPPIHHGFGYELLTNSLKFELGATSRVQFHPDGIVVHIAIPVHDRLLHESG